MQAESGTDDEGYALLNCALASFLNDLLPAAFEENVETVLIDDDDEQDYMDQCGVHEHSLEEAWPHAGSDFLMTDLEESDQEQHHQSGAMSDACSIQAAGLAATTVVDHCISEPCELIWDKQWKAFQAPVAGHLSSSTVDTNNQTAEDQIKLSCHPIESPSQSCQGFDGGNLPRCISNEVCSASALAGKELQSEPVSSTEDLQSLARPLHLHVLGDCSDVQEMLAEPLAERLQAQVCVSHKAEGNGVYRVVPAPTQFELNALKSPDSDHIEQKRFLNPSAPSCWSERACSNQADDCLESIAGQENTLLEDVPDVHTKGAGYQHASAQDSSKAHGNVAPAVAYDLESEKLDRGKDLLGRSKCTEAVGSALSVARVRHHRSVCAENFNSVDYIQSSQLVAADAYAGHKTSGRPMKLPTMARSIDTVLARSVSSPVHNRKQRTAQSYDFSPALSTGSSVGSTFGPGSENQSVRATGPRSRGSQSPCWPPVCNHVPAMSLLPAYAARTHKDRRPHATNRSPSDVPTQAPVATGKRTRCNSISPVPFFDDTPPCSRASRSRPGTFNSISGASTPLRLPPLGKSGKLSQELLLIDFGSRGRAPNHLR